MCMLVTVHTIFEGEKETLLIFQDDVRIELYLFKRYSGIRAICGNWTLIPPIDMLGQKE